MNQQTKQQILRGAAERVTKVRSRIKKTIIDLPSKMENMKELSSASRTDQLVYETMAFLNNKRIEELKALYPSPYFVRCEIKFNGDEKVSNLFFGKFGFDEEKIYSWVTPAASVRFEKMGTVTYEGPDGEIKKGVLLRRDQFMIVDGKIIFLATEDIDHPRELVYQDYFSSRKTGFVLPEIVEQMEKAQDQVIRAHHKGSFVISGPAGSGKTTLALHRVAYLTQSPETTELYPGESIVVFVQDNGTKKYFSHLLPELGIKNVTITTFSEWAREILQLWDYDFVYRFGTTETEKDIYEYKKNMVLQNVDLLGDVKYGRRPFEILKKIYQHYFSETEYTLFTQQSKKRVLDRFDLTILLLLYKKMYGELKMEKEYYVELKDSVAQKKKGLFAVAYSLVVVDEFQNYLPEQLKLFKECADKIQKSILYVGDMAQQVKIGTIRGWEQISEIISEERTAKLQKVYRNTKNILQYIKSVGYAIDIPNELRDGLPVIEKVFNSKKEEISYVLSATGDAETSIGILAKDESYLREYKDAFGDKNNIFIFTMEEAQGVEFDKVFLVGVDDGVLHVDPSLPEILQEEKRRVQKDLLYVALTRAMNELYVLKKDF